MPFPALAGLTIGQKLKKLAPYIAVALAVVALLTLTYCEGKRSGKAAAEIEQLEDDIETLEVVVDANETAAGERLADAEDLATQEEELDDARTTPGDDANTRRLRRLCIKLRQQGGDTANHPTCCRFEGAAGTCPAP